MVQRTGDGVAKGATAVLGWMDYKAVPIQQNWQGVMLVCQLWSEMAWLAQGLYKSPAHEAARAPAKNGCTR